MANLQNDGVQSPPRPPVKVHPTLQLLEQNRKASKDKRDNMERPETLTLYRSRTLPPLSLNKKDDLPVPPQGACRSGVVRKRQDTPSFSVIKRRPKSPVRFNALLQVSEPIPKFIEPRIQQGPAKTVVKSLQGWKNEVIKVVPERPAFAISSNWVAPPADWDDRDHYIYSPRCVFYRNIKHYEHKDFVVNPEWVSEKMTVSTFSPAYRTCALRYGWCS